MWWRLAKSEFTDDEKESLGRWHRQQEERDAARERYYREQFPRIIADHLFWGWGPDELARRLGSPISRVMEAIEALRAADPDFDRRVAEGLDENERRLREMDLFPASYDSHSGILTTENDDYVRARDGFERVVDEPGYERTGMPFPVEMGDIDPSLRGWKGIHTGDAEGWFPILVRDQFVNSPGHQYGISSEHIPLFEMEDPHPIDRGEVPSSQIVFTHPSFLLPGTHPMLPPRALEYRGEMNVEDYPDEGDEFGGHYADDEMEQDMDDSFD